MVFAEITGSRIWKTNVYDGVYFNDFIKSNMSGSRDLRGLIEAVLLTIAMI